MRRFFLSTARFRVDAFFETSPMAIAACSIQEEAALEANDPSLWATGPPHSLVDAGEDAGGPRQSRWQTAAALCETTEETARHIRHTRARGAWALFLCLLLWPAHGTELCLLEPPLSVSAHFSDFIMPSLDRFVSCGPNYVTGSSDTQFLWELNIIYKDQGLFICLFVWFCAYKFIFYKKTLK